MPLRGRWGEAELRRRNRAGQPSRLRHRLLPPTAMADVEDGDEPGVSTPHSGSSGAKAGGGADKMFSLKKWNAVAMWSWDVECDTCAICRVQMPVLDVKLKTNKRIVLWSGESVIIRSTIAACHCG
ncbi:RING-box protein 2 isoform X2 [Erythrolamprus reginae]|uniref:RING-box protein 2 isoform X2 n=1 Tax=Erythrolamprus reginae TaxID=121349 RepID=UPI00396CC849